MFASKVYNDPIFLVSRFLYVDLIVTPSMVIVQRDLKESINQFISIKQIKNQFSNNSDFVSKGGFPF